MVNRVNWSLKSFFFSPNGHGCGFVGLLVALAATVQHARVRVAFLGNRPPDGVVAWALADGLVFRHRDPGTWMRS
jgi:hypothetical protein